MRISVAGLPTFMTGTATPENLTTSGLGGCLSSITVRPGASTWKVSSLWLPASGRRPCHQRLSCGKCVRPATATAATTRTCSMCQRHQFSAEAPRRPRPRNQPGACQLPRSRPSSPPKMASRGRPTAVRRCPTVPKKAPMPWLMRDSMVTASLVGCCSDEGTLLARMGQAGCAGQHRASNHGRCEPCPSNSYQSSWRVATMTALSTANSRSEPSTSAFCSICSRA